MATLRPGPPYGARNSMRNRSFSKPLTMVSLMVFMAFPALAGDPAPRESAAMIYDAALGRPILFGGRTTADSAGIRWSIPETWEWTGSRWVQRYPNTSPPGRSTHGFVYEPSRKRGLMFGGFDREDILGDTWVWEQGDWRKLTPSVSPGPRFIFGMTYDPQGDRVLLYGGRGTLLATDVSLTDTWEFIGSTWRRVAENGPLLSGPLLGYDAIRREMILLGSNSEFVTEMYRLNGTTWEKMTPSQLPPCVSASTMVYVEHLQRLLVTGGICSNGLNIDQTWEWDGTDWTLITLTSTHEPRYSHAIAYDPKRHETLVFGGFTFDISGSTYRYVDEARWQLVSDTTTPTGRSLFVMEPDTASGVTWLFGGHNQSDEFFDLWKYQNGNWLQVTGGKTAPPVCLYPAGAFDSDRGRLVMICEDSTTWEWDGAEWASITSTDTPAARRFSSMVYDPVRKKTVLFGGYVNIAYFDETWTWDGKVWTRVVKAKNGPPARSNTSMFWDPSQQKIVVFGGIGRPTANDRIRRYGDTWSFDGTKWTEIKSLSNPPSPRYGCQARFDPVSGKVILFGGKNDDEEYINEQFEWNGTAWTKVTPARVPSARMNGAMFHDPSTGKTTLFGGYAGYHFSEIWELQDGTWVVRAETGSRRRSATRAEPAPATPLKTGISVFTE